ncbi:MAG: hypothetical protein CMF62_13120 [Magnetococcales bacterium]|nr:hypothetical protein [Magnetococcales bacterium]
MQQLKKCVVFGASGLLGPYVCQALTAHRYSVVEVGKDHAETSCDLTLPSETKKFIEKHQPAVVVNLVAMTNVDACEEHPGTADVLNRQTIENIVNAISPETQLVHVSTDQVYSEQVGTPPYTESMIGPINAYGRTKLAGEEEALKHKKSVVLRTNIFGASQTPTRKSLSDFFIESFQKQSPLKLFTDSIFTPLHMETVGEMIASCLEKEVYGVYNLASRNGMRKADFALVIANQLGASTNNAETMESTALVGRAPRPKDLRLDPSALEQKLGITMPTLEQEILKACAHLKSKSKAKQSV